MKYKVLDVEQWHRKEQYEFFRTFDEPFTGVMVDVNVTIAHQIHKEKNLSFFQIYLHKCLKAANATKAMRLRIVENEVREYDHLHASAVIMRSDKSFGFSHVQFNEDFMIFSANFEAEKARVEKDRALFPPNNSPNEVHCSAMPWIKFKGLSHARKFNSEDSSPKISFGKTFTDKNTLWMPLSVHVHHALADGLDMAEFINNYQNELNIGL